METRGRIGAERGKEVWLLVTSGNKIVDKFRTKNMAEKTKRYYLEKYGWDLEIKRDNQFKEMKDESKKEM